MLGVDQVALPEFGKVGKAEMVEILFEETGLVVVFRSSERTRMVEGFLAMVGSISGWSEEARRAQGGERWQEGE